MEYHAENLAGVKVTIFCSVSLFIEQIIFSWKINQVGQLWLLLLNPSCLFPVTLLPFICMQMASTRIYSNVFPKPEVRIISLFPRFLFFLLHVFLPQIEERCLIQLHSFSFHPLRVESNSFLIQQTCSLWWEKCLFMWTCVHSSVSVTSWWQRRLKWLITEGWFGIWHLFVCNNSSEPYCRYYFRVSAGFCSCGIFFYYDIHFDGYEKPLVQIQ